jgi:hypothetical protein
MLAHVFFPEVFLVKVTVNRRMSAPLERAYIEICRRWSEPKERAELGLNKFLKCYCFGDGQGPSLFWYGAAWMLASQVNGEVLEEVIRIFQRQGFTHDRKRIRVFEYW